MAGHTPGPWSYDDNTATVDTALGVAIAGINDEEWVSDSAWANGHLIAAAPDMYEAILGVNRVGQHGRIRDWKAAMDKALAAIAKAEGRDS